MQKCSYKSVFNIVHKEYYAGKHSSERIQEADQGYLKVYNELQEFGHKPNKEYQISVHEREDDLDGERFIDVSLYCPEDEKTYAVDLTPWEDLIDAKIKTDFWRLGHTATLAHILWEITFYGFSDKSIKLERDKLTELTKRIDSGEEKLTPWEGIGE